MTCRLSPITHGVGAGIWISTMFCDLHCNLTPFEHLGTIDAWRLAGMFAMAPDESFAIADLTAGGGRQIARIVLAAPTLAVSRHSRALPRSAWHSIDWTAPLELLRHDGYRFAGEAYLALADEQGLLFAAGIWRTIAADEATFCQDVKARCSGLLPAPLLAA